MQSLFDQAERDPKDAWRAVIGRLPKFQTSPNVDWQALLSQFQPAPPERQSQYVAWSAFISMWWKTVTQEPLLIDAIDPCLNLVGRVLDSIEWVLLDEEYRSAVGKGFSDALVQMATKTRRFDLVLGTLRRLNVLQRPKITRFHTTYFQIALLAESTADFQAILTLKQPTDIDADVSRLNAFVSLITLRLREFKRAMLMFEQVVMFPARVASAVQIESYKRYVLACLLYQGRLKPIAVQTLVGTAVSRAIKSQCTPYLEFAEAFASNWSSKAPIEAAITKHSAVFENDQTLSLVQLCMRSLPRHLVRQMSKAFSKVPLASVTNYCGLTSADETGHLLAYMVQTTREINASLDVERRIVEFKPVESLYIPAKDPNNLHLASLPQNTLSDIPGLPTEGFLNAQMTDMGALTECLQSIEREMLTSRVFYEQKNKNALHPGVGSGFGGTGLMQGMGFGFELHDQ